MDLILASGFLLLFCISAIASKFHKNLFMAAISGFILIFASLFILSDGLTMQAGQEEASQTIVTQNATHFITNMTTNITYVQEEIQLGSGFTAGEIAGSIGLVCGLAIIVWITAIYASSRIRWAQ